MRRFVLALASAVAVAVIAMATTAAGADRSPVTMSGLFPDDWGQSLSNADKESFPAPDQVRRSLALHD